MSEQETRTKIKIANICINHLKPYEFFELIRLLSEASDRFVGDSYDRAKEDELKNGTIYDINHEVFVCNQLIRMLTDIFSLCHKLKPSKAA